MKQHVFCKRTFNIIMASFALPRSILFKISEQTYLGEFYDDEDFDLF